MNLTKLIVSTNLIVSQKKHTIFYKFNLDLKLLRILVQIQSFKKLNKLKSFKPFKMNKEFQANVVISIFYRNV